MLSMHYHVKPTIFAASASGAKKPQKNACKTEAKILLCEGKEWEAVPLTYLFVCFGTAISTIS